MAGGGGAGGDGSGGGIFLTEFDTGGTVTSSMTVNGTTLDENTAGGEGGDGTGSGGAISSGAWDLALTGVTVSDNRAGVSDDAEEPAGFGGGIVASGEVGQDLDIHGSLLTRNQASEASGDSGEGGGALIKLGPGNLTIADSAITDNSVGGPDDTDGSVRGGGILRFEELGSSNPSDSIVRSTISGNQAESGGNASGGGVSIITPGSFEIDRSTFTDNTTEAGTFASAGGIHFEVFGADKEATLTNSTVHGNRALAPGLTATGGFGGGVRANTTASTPLLISHSTITATRPTRATRTARRGTCTRTTRSSCARRSSPAAPPGTPVTRTASTSISSRSSSRLARTSRARPRASASWGRRATRSASIRCSGRSP